MPDVFIENIYFYFILLVKDANEEMDTGFATRCHLLKLPQQTQMRVKSAIRAALVCIFECSQIFDEPISQSEMNSLLDEWKT